METGTWKVNTGVAQMRMGVVSREVGAAGQGFQAPDTERNPSATQIYGIAVVGIRRLTNPMLIGYPMTLEGVQPVECQGC